MPHVSRSCHCHCQCPFVTMLQARCLHRGLTDCRLYCTALHCTVAARAVAMSTTAQHSTPHHSTTATTPPQPLIARPDSGAAARYLSTWTAACRPSFHHRIGLYCIVSDRPSSKVAEPSPTRPDPTHRLTGASAVLPASALMAWHGMA